MYARFALLPSVRAASADLDRFEPRILADLRTLQAHPIFAGSSAAAGPPVTGGRAAAGPAATADAGATRERNAERFLSGFITWNGAEPLQTVDHDRLVAMMREHEHALVSDDDWSALIDDDALDDLDLNWVDQLAAYDHIDFGTHPAYIDLLSRVAGANGFERASIAARLPYPELAELRFATLARVAQLMEEDRWREASSLYRHVADLMQTSDSLIGSMMSVVMLQNEKSLRDRTGTPAWPVVDDDLIGAMKRTAWAWDGIEQLRPARLRDFEPYFNRQTGACAGLLEMFGTGAMLQDYLEPTAFLEYDLRPRLAKQTQFKKRLFEMCDHQNLEVFLAPMDEGPLMIGRLKPNPARIPFLRRILGLKILASESPTYFRLYEEAPRQPASGD